MCQLPFGSADFQFRAENKPCSPQSRWVSGRLDRDKARSLHIVPSGFMLKRRKPAHIWHIYKPSPTNRYLSL